MNSTSCWSDNDLNLVSDFRNFPATEPIKKTRIASERVQFVRSKPSIYDEPLEDLYDENEINGVRPLGRGRGTFVSRPGGQPSFLQNQVETSKRIREVSGFGYSNDLIEHVFRRDICKTPEVNKVDMSCIKLSPTSSNCSTPVNSPLKTKKINHISPELVSPPSSATHYLPLAPISNTSKLHTLDASLNLPQLTPKETAVAPRGLFDIINSAALSKQTKKMHSLGVRNTEMHNVVKNDIVKPPEVAYRPRVKSNVYDNSKREKDKLTLDIHSHTQFPALR